jgi:hypothetical protein
VLQRELNTSTVVQYVDRKLLDATESDDRFACCNRFPVADLVRARDFFASLAATAPQ